MSLESPVYSAHSFAVAVGNIVSPGTELLATVSYVSTLQAVVGNCPIEAYSRDTKNLLAPEVIGLSHGFVGAAQTAYAGHYPLVLSPDMIWLLIAQGFAIHVRQNAEALRHHFVAHQGKLELKVERSDFIRGFAGNDWESVFTEFSGLIRGHIGTTTHNTLVPNFSTTSIVEKAAFEVTLMDAMQSYFKYVVGIVCGIPHFLIEGTPEDWKQIRDRAAKLAQHDLEWWIPRLLPVLDEFIAASEGNADQAFWKTFYKEKEEVFGCGDPLRITGKITTFFPYLPANDEISLRDRQQVDYDLRESVQKELSLIFDPDEYTKQFAIVMRKMNRLPTRVFERNSAYWSIGPDTLPSALSCAPFTLVDRDTTKYAMEFVAGFVGASQDETSMAIRPEIGWAVRDAPTQS